MLVVGLNKLGSPCIEDANLWELSCCGWPERERARLSLNGATLCSWPDPALDSVQTP